MIIWTSLKNIIHLCVKEVKSVLRDYVLMGLIAIMFSVATYSVAKGIAVEVKNGSVAVVNEDQSPPVMTYYRCPTPTSLSATTTN